MDRRQNHGVRHETLARHEPLRLGHALQAGIDAGFVVE